MSGAIAERMAEISSEMNEILTEYRSGKNPAIFALRDKSIELLVPRRLLLKQTVSSRFVVTHPNNRYGDGIVPSHAHSMVDAFCANAFSLAEFGIPFATEVPPITNPRYKAIVAFNQKLVEDSCGLLPPIAEEEYKIMSAAKSHSSMGSRCVIFACPHENPHDDKDDENHIDITEDGRLSLHKIRTVRPCYAKVIEEGFEWNTLVWQAEEEFPALVDLMMETGNLGQQQAMDETRMQVMLKMHHCSNRLMLQTKELWSHNKPNCLTTCEIWEAVKLSLIHI